MSYETLRTIHVVCVIISVSGFALRGLLMLADSPLLQRRWARSLPHLNDTILLSAAIALAVMSGQYPFMHGWLTAKFIGLALYIALGAVALKPGGKKSLRALAFVSALVVVSWMISVAVTRHPLGYFLHLI